MQLPALPIKKLKGTEPVELHDFSRKQLGPASAIVIASLIGANASLTSLSVASNGISGDGAQQLASAVLAKPNLEVFSGIPLKELRADSLTTLALRGKGLGVPEAIVLADLLRSVSPSLTSLNLSLRADRGIRRTPPPVQRGAPHAGDRGAHRHSPSVSQHHRSPIS